VLQKVTASAGCWDVLVVTGSAAEEVAEFVVLSAESICRLMLLKAAHTSDASFDPAMVLFKSIVQVDARPVTDVAAQCRADRARVRIMPVCCHPVRRISDNRPCRAEEPLGRFHVTGPAQHRVDEVPVAIDRPIQVSPAAMDLEVFRRHTNSGQSCVQCRGASCAAPRPSRATASLPTAGWTYG
jgi:hypothetical protein